MNELTDLEICKAISLIELNEQFPKAKSIEFDDRQNCFWLERIGFTSWLLLEPLTDDALCFRMMIKYKIDINFSREDNKIIAWHDEYVEIESTIPNRAICLAIIKSKE
jgi:hypothetical protein